MNFIKVTDNENVFADGVHDDTKALQECIDKVKDGGTIYFPDGTYLISSTLIFYSNQTFRLSDNAVILRSKESNPVTRYLLAAYSEPQWSGYEGTHDVVISGGIFDGNADLMIFGGTPVAKAAYWTTTDAEARKRGEQTGLDTLVVHAVNDEH